MNIVTWNRKRMTSKKHINTKTLFCSLFPIFMVDWNIIWRTCFNVLNHHPCVTVFRWLSMTLNKMDECDHTIKITFTSNPWHFNCKVRKSNFGNDYEFKLSCQKRGINRKNLVEIIKHEAILCFQREIFNNNTVFI